MKFSCRLSGSLLRWLQGAETNEFSQRQFDSGKSQSHRRPALRQLNDSSGFSVSARWPAWMARSIRRPPPPDTNGVAPPSGSNDNMDRRVDVSFRAIVPSATNPLIVFVHGEIHGNVYASDEDAGDRA